MRSLVIALFAVLLVFAVSEAAEQSLYIATFQIDATPPLGSPLSNTSMVTAKKVIEPLTARGLIILTDQKPIVLCAVDWIGIGNGSHDEWREALAEAAGTASERVSVNTVHQHDAPGCDFSAEELLAENGLSGAMFNVEFARETIARAAEAVRKAMKTPLEVTHIGMGKGLVKNFASNRRIFGEDGKVVAARYTACEDPAIRAAPEGIIDPYVRNITFWNSDVPIVSLTYYATHPQSFYGMGAVSTDTVGIARSLREATLPEVFHIHFDGAGGDIGAGKYNNGAPVNRLILASLLALGMETAWKEMVKVPITAADVEWRVRPVALPLSERLAGDEEKSIESLASSTEKFARRLDAARDLAWARRVKAGHKIDLTCLRLGPAYVLHMPGELFVEYELAAQEMLPENMVCMAAYGDYAPGYICTEIAYSEGGYETGRESRVSPAVEGVLMDGIRDLLGVKESE